MHAAVITHAAAITHAAVVTHAAVITHAIASTQYGSKYKSGLHMPHYDITMSQ